jgi:hypothetical protein
VKIKKIVTLAIVSLALSQAASAASADQISVDEAKLIACAEAARIEFTFDGVCEDYFDSPRDESSTDFIFLGLDISGDCGIEVSVEKISGNARSKVSCD